MLFVTSLDEITWQFRSLSGKERATDQLGRLAGQYHYSRVFSLNSRLCAASGMLALAGVLWQNHPNYMTHVHLSDMNPLG